MVPFAIEDGGRRGAHALALLNLATVDLEKDKRHPFAQRAHASPPSASLSVGPAFTKAHGHMATLNHFQAWH